MTVNVDALHKQVRTYARERAERLGDAFIEQLRGNMPRRTGDMADSAEVESIEEHSDGVKVKVVVRSKYAGFQNYGTGIYGPEGTPITPKRANGVLVFDWPAAGGVVFARSVRGTEPTHFWERTLDQWPTIIAETA
jgi:HK97 gp10 family phage protein